MGVRRNFYSGGEQNRHFAYPFQVAVDAMQMDVHETLHPFYITKNAQCYGNCLKKCASLAALLLFHPCFFSHSMKLRGLLLSAVIVSRSVASPKIWERPKKWGDQNA